MSETMKAATFVEPGRIVLVDQPIPTIGPRNALIRITTATICGTDVHILKSEYPVARGMTIGHEPVGVIVELGSAVTDYRMASASSRARLRLVDNVVRAWTATRLNVAVRRWAGGASETRLTAARPNT